MDEATARALVEDARVGVLATHGPDGVARLVPCVFVLRGDTLYTPVDGKPKSTRDLQRVRDVRHDPRVSVVVHQWNEDWTHLWWVRLRGSGRIVDDPVEAAAARMALRSKYEQYATTADDELDPVIAVDVAQWRGWSGSPPPGVA